MAIREIVTFPDERLRQICAPVTEFDASLKELTDDMFETMYDDEGIGLAAPQIGKSIRFLVIDGSALADEMPELKDFKRVMINPEVLEQSEETAEYGEGCRRRGR